MSLTESIVERLLSLASLRSWFAVDPVRCAAGRLSPLQPLISAAGPDAPGRPSPGRRMEDGVGGMLSALPRGMHARVQCVADNGDAARLRELGVCEGEPLEVVCAGDPMVCRVGGGRVGICARLAAAVRVTACARAIASETGTAGLS